MSHSRVISTSDTNTPKKAANPDHELEEIPEADLYSQYICANPWRAWGISLTLIISFALFGAVIILTVQDFSLSGATVGFENRGTDIAGEILTKGHISVKECTGDLALVADGSGSTFYSDEVVYDNDEPWEVDGSTCYDGYTSSSRRRLVEEKRRRAEVRRERELSGRQLAYGDDLWYNQKFPPLLVAEANSWSVMENSKEGMSIFFSGADLFTKDAIIGMCERHTLVLEAIPTYDSICYKQQPNGDELCKPPRSIGHYIAAIQGRDSCSDITDADVSAVKSLLQTCRSFFDDGSLVGNCWDFDGGTTNGTYTNQYSTNTGDPFCTLPWGNTECARYNAVYDIFYSLTPSNWMASDNTEPLRYAQILTAEDIQSDPATFLQIYYDDLQPMSGEAIGGATCEVVYMDLKGTIFSDKMLSESSSFAILFLVIYCLLLYHTGSFWIATCSAFQIMMAFFWGVVFYSVVAWRTFFPFLNLIALFLILGVGADDVFVFVDAWKQSFSLLPRHTPLDKRLSWVLRRAGGAMLVTTLTTSSSFFANIISPISALKGFGLFTGMVVMADYFLMLLFIPPTVVVHHLYFSVDAGKNQLKHRQNPCCSSGAPGCPLPFPDDNHSVDNSIDNGLEDSMAAEHAVIAKKVVCVSDTEKDVEHEVELHSCCCKNCICCITSCNPDFCDIPKQRDASGKLKQRWGEDIFEFVVSPILLNDVLRWGFFAIALTLTCTVGFNSLNLERPSSSYMQLLDASHPLELYEKTYVDYFDIEGGDSFMFPYYAIAGIHPVDNGDIYNPSSRGTPVYIDIDLSSAEGQQWGYDTCTHLADWTLTPQSGNSLDTNPCVFYWFKQWMQGNCAASGTDSVDSTYMVYMPARSSSEADYSGSCCDKVDGDFPYDESTFTTCIKEFANYWGGEQKVNHGIWFDSSGNIKVMMLQGETTIKYSQMYDTTKNFYTDLKSFWTERPSAPANSGLDKAWISTELQFYALQMAITEGAYQAVALSTLFAFIVLIVLTRRPLSSMFAAIQISATVACSVGVFVYLGWELNVVESIILSVSVGLACDFSGHLAHAFNDSHTHLEKSTAFEFPRTFDAFIAQYQLATAKATHAMAALGVTITLGFLTTFLSGVVLMGGSLYFFQQFGIFMCTLMSFSYAFVFLMLMTFLATFGWKDRLLADFVIKHLPDAFRPTNHKFSHNANVDSRSKQVRPTHLSTEDDGDVEKEDEDSASVEMVKAQPEASLIARQESELI